LNKIETIKLFEAGNMTNLEQIKQTAAQIHLNLDNPQSVKEQLQQINQAEKQLRQMKQEVSGELQQIKQKANSFGLDEAASIGLHFLGQHQVARQVQRQGNKVERRQKLGGTQPFEKMQNLIDNYLFECDRLKLMAQNYLQDK
jgi:uncharacterized membrane protein YgaE (UPF0421/DUF939 family)